MFNEDLEKVLREMPESGHKIIVMAKWHKLLKKLNIPQPFCNNVELCQALAEFSLSFFTAIGFATGQQASANEEDPTVKLAAVAASVTFVVPFIFNILTKIKVSGRKGAFPMVAYVGAQIGSIFSMAAVLIQGLRLTGSAQSLGAGEEIKNCFLVAMAGVYAGHSTGLLTHEILMRGYDIFHRPPPPYSPTSGSFLLPTQEQLVRPNLEKIKKAIRDYNSTAELQFLLIFFVIVIININQGAREGLQERGLGDPFSQNIILFPLTSLLANVMAHLYRRIME